MLSIIGSYLSVNSFFNQKYSILLIFSIGCFIRVVPEIIAYPYPVGYDVINYYIPAVTFFETQWSYILGQFPAYVFLLYLIGQSTGLDPYHTVIAVAIAMFGIFTVTLFLVGRKILNLSGIESTFLSVFVIIQSTLLRTAASTHRDILALTT